MRPGIVLHQEEPRAHCTSVRSDNGSEDFIPVPNSSRGADTGPAAGLLPFYGPVQLSSCNGPSPVISTSLLRLCWETQQTLRRHVYGCAILEELDYLCNLNGLQNKWGGGNSLYSTSNLVTGPQDEEG
ncbi:hypothetical protein SKAU_G00343580 [Synaphobranchus kaupii]|uniref:Uncharacterized protein n=1 Tax=Synaphobranchus kaupii TaxID=118154 RepID=A0A9Q1EJ48_SYNKA|nr:hypothetical protein SKAU_G00343580 [Synaphobranchus kaupii]